MAENQYASIFEAYKERMKSAIEIYFSIILQRLENADTAKRAKELSRLESMTSAFERGETLVPSKVGFSGTYFVIPKGNYSSFNEVLQDFRKQLGITQAQLAQSAGVSLRLISELKCNKLDNIRPKTREKLLKIFTLPEDRVDYFKNLPLQK